MRIDLHTHTAASDGMLTPPELVQAALAQGLDVIAVTDHDTVAGVVPAIEAAAATPLRVLAGVELSARHHGRTMHLLGYGFDPADVGLIAQLTALAGAREERAGTIVARLAALGAPVAWDDVTVRARGTVGRPHIAQALVAAGHARDVADAFGRFLGTGRPAHVPSARLSAEEAIAMVRAAGGQVALAHPLQSDTPLAVETLLPDLCAAGLTGLEVYHSEHDARATGRLRRLADAYGLWWTGGSDFHGDTQPRARLGGVEVPPPSGGPVAALLTAHGAAAH